MELINSFAINNTNYYIWLLKILIIKFMTKEFRLNIYLSYGHALSDIMHIVFGLTLYFVSDDLNLSILSMGILYNTASIFRGISGVISGMLSDNIFFVWGDSCFYFSWDCILTGSICNFRS